MKKILEKIKHHMDYWGENYYASSLTVAFLLVAIYAVRWFTGRPVLDDLGAIVGMFINAIGLCIAAALTGQFHKFLFGYQKGTTIWDSILDIATSLILFALLSYRIFN